MRLRALLSDGDHPAALYGLAAALAGQNRLPTPSPIWSDGPLDPSAGRALAGEARFAHFARLQGDAASPCRRHRPRPGPRARATRPGRLRCHWEQTGTPCQDPTVNLELDRKSDKSS